ncbi:peptidoglycan/xylan/chitin deacetylase (PgdA/CDA1 family) [Flavobacterium endophyticum]|uniref:Peptidoglycan/xylan/chitin deacetylase (PgdA/CDA1 family) n=1 Tax=Flavobacterium endophyticum TaxID=1540163 RepID=A0A495MIX8_9FLAO|nr:polysaccharide deacetylase family protein [Flavobacterium endophyticum]RKS25957.1 peptidoglycan/xylan/chitin deacetylase (PgdA/CDA1 family) [Flavobacterium endophyticum]
MDLLWVKTNRLIKWLFPKYTWDIPNNANKIYLTFDDGPTPEITEWVLKLLKEQDIKATFFCIGNNIEKYPDIFQKVLQEGHAIGNHTYNHLKGWKTAKEDYIENTKSCERIIKEYTKDSDRRSKLFRPPYGKIKFSQAKILRQLGYKIVMWDVISVDYDKNISPKKCLKNVTKNTASGSVIVFHDSIKAFDNLKFALPEAIRYLKNKGFVFDRID